MKYVALLRGINAGKNKGIDAKELNWYSNLWDENVSTYKFKINIWI